MTVLEKFQEFRKRTYFGILPPTLQGRNAQSILAEWNANRARRGLPELPFPAKGQKFTTTVEQSAPLQGYPLDTAVRGPLMESAMHWRDELLNRTSRLQGTAGPFPRFSPSSTAVPFTLPPGFQIIGSRKPLDLPRREAPPPVSYVAPAAQFRPVEELPPVLVRQGRETHTGYEAF